MLKSGHALLRAEEDEEEGGGAVVKGLKVGVLSLWRFRRSGCSARRVSRMFEFEFELSFVDDDRGGGDAAVSMHVQRAARGVVG